MHCEPQLQVTVLRSLVRVTLITSTPSAFDVILHLTWHINYLLRPTYLEEVDGSQPGLAVVLRNCTLCRA